MQTAAIQPTLLSPTATGLTGFGATQYLPTTTTQPAPGNTATRIFEPLPASAVAGGLGAIVAPGAAQSGVVGALVKRQQLGARDTVSLDLYGDQLVSFTVSDAVAEQISKAIGVGGSQVALTAGAAKAVVDNVVNLGGKSKADVAVKVGDKVMLGSADEIAAADDRTSKFVNSGTLGTPVKAGLGGKTSVNTAASHRFDWVGARSDASLPLALGASAFASSNILRVGPSLTGIRSFPPISIFTPPGGWTAPGTTVSYSIHRPGGIGGFGVNATLGFGLPPGTVVVTYAMTHRPGNNPPGGSAGVAGNSGSGGSGAPGGGQGSALGGALGGGQGAQGSALGVGQGSAQGGAQGSVPAGGSMVVALTEIVPSPFDLNDEASPARFMLTGSAAQTGSAQGISGGRGVASAADLGRGNQAGADVFTKKQHVVEAPGCRTEFAGYTYFTRDVFGRELISVCTLASASAAAVR